MYFLDSNIIIGFLNGDKKIKEWIKNERENYSHFSTSVISKIEVLSHKSITNESARELELFLDIFNPRLLASDDVNLCATLIRNQSLTLGDAIIAAAAIKNNQILVTNDKALIKKVQGLVETLSLS